MKSNFNWSLEFIFWFLLPVIIAIIIISKSINTLIKTRNLKNWLLTICITILILFSLTVLCSIFFYDTYPTFIPYFAIGISIILYSIQFILNVRKNHSRR